ncbi:MAG TPA: pectinesterase family protein [Verrucomicrobiae bacterium]|nr:pectinesterase family protein [Verrucomicrobiae bacterium]
MTNRIHPGAIVPLAAALFCFTTHAELAVTNRYPVDHAAGICPDTPLRLTFNAPVTLGNTGQLKVVRMNDGKIVDALEVADGGWTNLFGTKLLRYEPFRIDGNTITVQLRAHVLEGATNTTFAVVIEPGVFKSAGGEAFGSMTNGEWLFTTRAPLPKNRTRLEVAPDSRGDFCTLQGAADYIPEDNYTPFEIYIRKGTYDAVAYLGPGRNRIRVVGEDRKESILAGRNNDKLNPGRMMRPFISADADDVTFENLTIRNTTPYRGSQAEALRLSGQRCTIRDCDFYSFQDTLLLNGRVYVANCYVEGDVDFIWGHGVTFFENCELKAMHDGYYVTSRNPEDQFGFVFSHCRLTAAPDVKRNWLARIGTDRFPGSAVAFLNCQMAPHIPAAGWQIRGEDRAHLRLYEFNSTTLDGRPLDVSQRNPASRQLSRAEAAALSDPNQVLACQDHWKPKP